MPLKVMDVVEQRLAVLQEPGWSGRSVAEVCARNKISRTTFYEWARRYELDGLAGLAPGSRRPHHSPAQVDEQTEDAIVELRKQHGWGARKIRDALLLGARRRGDPDPVVPVKSTVEQILARRGLLGVARQADVSVPVSGHRFERAASNELWQVDGAHHRLADQTPYWSVELLDDHSRFCPGIGVGSTLSGQLAWTTLVLAVEVYGLPEWMLSDNGRCFTGRLDRQQVSFERRLAEAGIRFTHSRPYHPQTCGKVERFHRTQREWLARRDPPTTLVEAAALMATFRAHYNDDRPHEALAGLAPVDRYRPGDPLLLPTVDLPPADFTPPGALARKTRPSGRFGYAGRDFDLGERFASVTVGIVREPARLHVYYGSSLIQTFLVKAALPTPTR